MSSEIRNPQSEIVLLFASQNKNKAIEIQAALGPSYLIKSLLDLGYQGELDEPFDTFQANAEVKAKQGYDLFGMPCFAEDAGLVIEALNGRPGVLSARYAGKNKNPETNMDKVLNELKDIQNRAAYFISIIAYYDGHTYHHFEGRISGKILREKSGIGGFGYDPIFLPDGYDQSFGVLSPDIKSKISHRAIAVKKFIEYLHSRI